MHPRAPKHDALKLAKSFDYPPGYSLALGGAGQDQKKLFTEMLIALLSGIGVVLALLPRRQSCVFTQPALRCGQRPCPINLIERLSNIMLINLRRHAHGVARGTHVTAVGNCAV